MFSTDIQKDDWSEFFDDFTHAHQSWLVRMTNMGADSGVLGWENELPFEGLTLQLDNGITCISIIVRQDSVPPGHLLHSVNGATQITLGQSEDNEHLRLHIKAMNNVITTFAFRRAAVPDQQTKPGNPKPSL